MKYLLTLICVTIFNIHCLSAQSSVQIKIDSLQTFIKNSKNDTIKVIAYQDLAKCFFKQGKVQEMLDISDEGILIAEELNYASGQAQLILTKGVVFYATGKCNKAINLYKLALDIAKEIKKSELEAKIYINTGTCYQQIGDIDMALENYLSAYNLKQHLQKPHLASLLNNIGAIYRVKKKYNRAEEIYLNSYNLKKETKDSLGMATSLMNLGLVYYLMKGKEKLAIKTLNTSKIFYTNLKRDYDVASCHTALGRVYLDLGNLPKAKEELTIAWEYFKNKDISDYYCHTLTTLGEVSFAKNEYKASEVYFTKAKEAVEELNKKHDETDILIGLSKAKHELGKDTEAYKLITKAISLKDTLNEVSRLQSIEELQAKFDIRQKESELKISELKLNQRTKQRNFFLVTASGLLLFIIMLFFFLKQRTKANHKITAQNELIHNQKITKLQQESKLLSLSSMIEGQEAERIRIAKDLHDGLGGLLSTIKAHCSAIKNENDTLEKKAIEDKTNGLIDNACMEVRRISHNMIPHALTLSGLPNVLDDMSQNLSNEGYTIDLDVKDFPNEMDKTKQAVLYRLIQEIISNIRKHANATNILIQLFGRNDGLSLIVEDNGEGFDYDKALKSGGVGLKNINSRVEFLNGEIDWNSSLEKGTTITIDFPRTSFSNLT